MFVVDSLVENLYHFDLNKNRTELSLLGDLKDRIATTADIEESEIIFAEGFGVVSDIEVGPYDSCLYTVSNRNGKSL
jgi:aldose sugar dehydrogenase